MKDKQGNEPVRPGKAPRDISNPPVYPLLLAGLQVLTPEPGDLLDVREFSIYRPNLYIAILNQALFGLGVLLVFRLALTWFNRSVAWMSAVLFGLTDLYWRFTVSGLSTILLIDLILVLAWVMSRYEQGTEKAARWLPLQAVLIGAITGLAMLTRYSFGWLIVPVLIFVAACGGRRRGMGMTLVLLAFLAVAGPWVVRTTLASGLPFGTATYAVVEEIPAFAADTLPRTLEPAFPLLPDEKWQMFVSVIHKGLSGLKVGLVSDLPRLGGNWLSAFFLAGLLVKFRGANVNRTRWFVAGALLIMLPVQALARTHLSAEVPEVNSENLLVVLAPIVLIFGVGFFFTLFDAFDLLARSVRVASLTGFGVIICLPLGLALLAPRVPVNPPPYYPPRIQQLARYLEPGELWMSDIPWAVAWYGDRPCVWLRAEGPDEFFKNSDFSKKVNGLYVSTRTTDAKFYSNWAGENRNWGQFLLQIFVAKQIPDDFPLKNAPEGMLMTAGELVLTDRDRWSQPGGAEKVKKD